MTQQPRIRTQQHTLTGVCISPWFDRRVNWKDCVRLSPKQIQDLKSTNQLSSYMQGTNHRLMYLSKLVVVDHFIDLARALGQQSATRSVMRSMNDSPAGHNGVR